ncbi:MAG: zf-TFIIB domain-containing protein [Gemmatimonadetes bacterium]|nr:zf-TFIIB domain-containing protein [Gemmatimonadota bacterium]
MPDKPSSNEEEYFLKLEAERLEKRRQEAAARRTEEEKEGRRKLHHMHCPKCGGQLVEERYHGVQVDRCSECRGVWFDAGEAESLLEKAPGALQSFFGDLVSGMGGGKKRT